MLLRKKYLFGFSILCIIFSSIFMDSCKDGEKIELQRDVLTEKVAAILPALDGKIDQELFDSILTRMSLDSFDILPQSQNFVIDLWLVFSLISVPQKHQKLRL